jgi:hypothetical protein
LFLVILQILQKARAFIHNKDTAVGIMLDALLNSSISTHLKLLKQAFDEQEQVAKEKQSSVLCQHQ